MNMVFSICSLQINRMFRFPRYFLAFEKLKFINNIHKIFVFSFKVYRSRKLFLLKKKVILFTKNMAEVQEKGK